MNLRIGCCPCVGNFTETVKGCAGAGWAGATVTAKQGGLAVASGTTDSGGQVVLNVPDGSTQIVVVPNHARFATPSAATITVSGTTAHTTNLTAATGYVCCNACNLPLKTTLLLTDSNATITLTWVPTFSLWSYGYSLGNQTVIHDLNGGGPCNTDSEPVALGYTVQCGGAGHLTVKNHWITTGSPPGCGNFLTNYLAPSTPANNAAGVTNSNLFGTGTGSVTNTTQSSLSCVPLNWTGTLGTPTASPGGAPTPTGMPAGTVTVTETP